jgi:uncharacterized protein
MPPRATDDGPGSRTDGGKVYCAWQSLSDPGLEIVTLQRQRTRLIAEGKALRVNAGLVCALTWRIECDRDWRTRAMTVWPTGTDRPLLAVECDGRGVWKVSRGKLNGRIAGCVDIHVAGGPFCHTLPIRRLALSVPGQEVRLRMALADPFTCSIRPVRRSYTLLKETGGGHLFRYRDLDNEASSSLLVDDFGLVQHDEGHFRMVWCA